jgi:predicted DCC family thiol-disulfide oxidoreductase YuxK
MFYDGECPLCLREVRWLRRLDVEGRIRFTDIAATAFDAGALGLDLRRMMARIHARLPNGELIEGVEVFRRVYAAIGYQRLVRISRWPGISWLLEQGYRWFAQNRLRLTGRCEDGACAVQARE